jgi:hypothetical protein
MIYHTMSLTTVSVSPRRVISLSQWFITLCLWLLYQYHQDEWYIYHSDVSHYVSDYCISITKMSDTSITVIYHTMSLTVLYQYHQDEWYLYHNDLSHYVSDYCISITKKSDISITMIYHAMSLTTVSVSPRWVIHLSEWFITLCLWLLYQYHQDEWYIYHSDLSHYVSDCTVSVSLRRVICLSQWFIMLCLWLYCTSITKKSDMFITVIYHAMSLTVLYQYH